MMLLYDVIVMLIS